jgi:outer membrane protein assembly factor BamE (lipoprotein component of BamABCDE complex)
MSLNAATRRFAPLAIALALVTGLGACTTGLGGFMSDKVQGYDLSSDGLAQIRNGQSQDLVTMVLGSPQLSNDFGQESAFYYVETKLTQTAFGMSMVKERTVLAVYFDKNKRVTDRAVYSLKDGKAVTIETRRTPSYGEDRTFIQSILSSFSGNTVDAGTPHL